MSDAICKIDIATESIITTIDCLCEYHGCLDPWVDDDWAASQLAGRILPHKHYGLLHVDGLNQELRSLQKLETGVAYHVYAVCSPEIATFADISAPSVLEMIHRLAISLSAALSSIANRTIESKEQIDEAWGACGDVLLRFGLNMTMVALLRTKFEKEQHLVQFALADGRFTGARYDQWNGEQLVEPNAQPDKQEDNRRKIRSFLPANPQVIELARVIRRQRGSDTSMQSIALEFTDGDVRKAQSLLRQLRPDRYGHLLD